MDLVRPVCSEVFGESFQQSISLTSSFLAQETEMALSRVCIHRHIHLARVIRPEKQVLCEAHTMGGREKVSLSERREPRRRVWD